MRATEPERDFRAGFTIVEILIVLVVLAVVSAIALAAYGRALEKARVTRAMAEIRSMEKEIARYEIDQDELPASLTDLPWYVEADPWGRPYEYLRLRGRGWGWGQTDAGRSGKPQQTPGPPPKARRLQGPINSTFDLFSPGKDGQSEPMVHAPVSLDDVIRGADGNFIGLATDFREQP